MSKFVKNCSFKNCFVNVFKTYFRILFINYKIVNSNLLLLLLFIQEIKPYCESLEKMKEIFVQKREDVSSEEIAKCLGNGKLLKFKSFALFPVF